MINGLEKKCCFFMIVKCLRDKRLIGNMMICVWKNLILNGTHEYKKESLHIFTVTNLKWRQLYKTNNIIIYKNY